MTREEAIEVYNGLINTKIKEAFEFFAPELRESEKIRKDIVAAVEMYGDFTQSRKEEIYAYLEKQKELFKSGRGLYYYDGEKTTYCGYPATEENPYDFAMSQQEVKQKEQNGGIEECTDFTIYHPLKNGKGEYECIPYSFYGSLTSFSEDKDLIDFLRTCFYTKEECNEWIERQKEQKLEEEDHITPNKKFFQWIYDRLVFIHGENPDVDYMRSLKDRIKEMSSKQKSAEVDESTKRLNENWMKQYFDDYKEQKPAEWSEEDELMRTAVIQTLERFGGCGTTEMQIDWLKSLRPSWKPSEEQMEALKYAAYHTLPGEEYRDILFSLLKDLTKLM